VLEGSVRKAGNRLRISTQLVDVATSFQLWSERYDREMQDVFAIQDEIATSIVNALKVVLTPKEEAAIKKIPTQSVRAYEYYLRGRQLFHQRRPETLDAAEDLYRRAIALDPDYALAYAGLADCSCFRFFEHAGGDEALAQAESASRRALKLDPALTTFGVDPAGLVCADIGASTGGFTDVLLQRGATRVIAIDVGYGQLAWALRQDPRVTVLERVNIRYLERLPAAADLAVIDVSFISLRHVLPPVRKLLSTPADVIALVKPQFEVGKGAVGKGGIVRDADQHQAVLRALRDFAVGAGYEVVAETPSPILGTKGNREFFLHLRLRD
jgi:23S rRNA (cytidine1920-2'-O)/16S rRNA (cytidine1409-2'-O)-methyltransferase